MNGKAKGSQFERDVAKILDEWWGVKPHTFWRTPLSGGWNVVGDIAVMNAQDQPSEELKFPIIVECKAYKTIDLLQILTRLKTTKLFTWWEQVTREQQQHYNNTGERKSRLLIVKINNFPILSLYSLQEFPSLHTTSMQFIFNSDKVALCLFSDFRNVFTKLEVQLYHNIKTGDK